MIKRMIRKMTKKQWIALVVVLVAVERTATFVLFKKVQKMEQELWDSMTSCVPDSQNFIQGPDGQFTSIADLKAAAQENQVPRIFRVQWDEGLVTRGTSITQVHNLNSYNIVVNLYDRNGNEVSCIHSPQTVNAVQVWAIEKWFDSEPLTYPLTLTVVAQ